MTRRPRIPAALLALLAAVLVVGLAWSLLLPPFQAPDENSHFGYTQHLAEAGTIPGLADRPAFSSEQQQAAIVSGSDQTAALVEGRPSWDPRADEAWRARDLPEALRADGGGPNPAAPNPPLYYLYAAAAYEAAPGDDLFARLEVARIASLLWLLVTAVGAWLLAGEVLGRVRLLQLAAAGVAALLPMVAFISASVNPDGMLYALWTLALWLGVRTIRRGAPPVTAAALFAVVAAAVLTKTTSYALVPGALLALGAGLLRAPRPAGRVVLTAGVAGAALVVPLAVWFLVAAGLDRPAAAQIADADTTLGLAKLREFTSYLWQFYLPKLPFQAEYPTFTGAPGAWMYWIKGGWGQFAWLEVTYPRPLYWALALVTAAVGAGVLVALWRARRRLDLWVAAFVVVVAGALLAGLHWTDYTLAEGGRPFMQGRYLLPLAGLAGLAVAAVVRLLAPRARGVAVGVVLGGLVGLQLLALGLTAMRFYA